MEDEINLLDYWRVVVKRRKLIIWLTVAVVLTTLIYSLLQPKMYKATASIMVVDTGGGGLASALAAVPFLGGVGGGSGGGEGRLIPVLKSTALAKMVTQNLNLQELFPKLYQNVKLTEVEKMQSAAGSLQGAVEAKSVEGLLNVSIVWKEPKQAADLANRYVEQLGKFLNTRSLNVNFQVIDPAVAPLSKFKPKTKLNVMIGGILGLFTGVFIAFFLEYLENLPRADHGP